jgi:hypothetical protein
MNREMLDKKMQELPSNTSELCARADDLVAYLYGEANESEAKDFEAHLQHCGSCRTELLAFGQVRASINDWRQATLGSLGAPALADQGVPALSGADETRTRARSAISALREFFTLSPMWMRAATAVASVCVCALVVLAIAHAELRWDASGLSFRTGISRERVVELTKTIEVEKPVVVGYSQEELDRIVAERVRKERESFNDQQPAPVKIITTSAQPRPSNLRNSTQAPSGTTQRNTSRQTVAQRDPLNEEDIPRLYDLLGESN